MNLRCRQLEEPRYETLIERLVRSFRSTDVIYSLLMIGTCLSGSRDRSEMDLQPLQVQGCDACIECIIAVGAQQIEEVDGEETEGVC